MEMSTKKDGVDNKKLREVIRDTNVNRWVAIIATGIAFISSIFAAYIHIDNRYAIKKEINRQMYAVEKKLEEKVKNDLLKETLLKIWDLEDSIGENPIDKTTIRELKRLREKKKLIENELIILKQNLERSKSD